MNTTVKFAMPLAFAIAISVSASAQQQDPETLYKQAYDLLQRAPSESQPAQGKDLREARDKLTLVYTSLKSANVAYALAYAAALLGNVDDADKYSNDARTLSPPLSSSYSSDLQSISDWVTTTRSAAEENTTGQMHTSAATAAPSVHLPPSLFGRTHLHHKKQALPQ